MAYNVFLKFEPEVAGESKTKGFVNQIELTRWNFGVHNGAFMESGKKLQAGTVSCESITVTKRNDASSAALMGLCAKGKVGKALKATITVCISGEDAPKPLITITMENVLVSSVTMAGYTEGTLEDSVTLCFSKVLYQYEIKNASGTDQAKPKFTYDLEAQTAQVS